MKLASIRAVGGVIQGGQFVVVIASRGLAENEGHPGILMIFEDGETPATVEECRAVGAGMTELLIGALHDQVAAGIVAPEGSDGPVRSN